MSGERGDISFEKNPYPFQISVNHAETVHMRQTVRNVNQLNGTSVRLCGNGDRGATHKLDTVHTFVLSNKLDDITIFHPLGDHRKPVFTYRHSEEWQDVRMPEVLPGNSLSAEALQSIDSYGCGGAGRIEDSH